jgi:hypothetical protein
MNNPNSRTRLLIALVAATTLTAYSGLAAPNPDRDVFFGQTHVHTSWSFDAYVFGNTVTGPEDAYKFALGQPIKHPAGYEVKIKKPLDFQAVTDHAEYAGTIKLANDPTSSISKLPIAEKLKVRSKEDIQKIYLMLGQTIIDNKPIAELVSPEVAGSIWQQVIAIADKYNQPGKFTTFVAYEWTSTPNNQNMHRNIIFKDSKKVATIPFSSMDSTHPEDLWAWMDGQRKAGNELLCISHNGNLSDGIMFPLEVDNKGRPIDAAWAQTRMNNEPLSEIQQLKGASETTPQLSPNDEFAGHEILDYLLGGIERTPRQHGSYIREAFQNGLAFQDTRGFNPYKFGVVGASDSHDTAIAYTEDDFFGGHGLMDGELKTRTSGKKEAGMDMRHLSTSGLGGVWAEENTRESIFSAMQRKEVYGTSGVRIKVRLFGGWNYKEGGLGGDWVKQGYGNGVPMGGDLPAPKDSKAPSFIVWATKDPDDGNLDRIQIIKGWTKQGQIFEKVFDVAWSGDRKPDATGKVPPVGNTVNISEATYKNTIGATELKKVWTDPEFDPSLHAFYYARVLQIPTPRWTTYDAKKAGIAPPSVVPTTVQERAWTSPIWFTPTEAAAKKGKTGVTLVDLKAKGATALDDAALKALIVGKTFKVRNTATGQQFEIRYGTDGRRVIISIDGKQPEPGDMFDVTNAGNPGSPAAYAIKDGRIETTLEGSPFEVTVYKAGDKYIAARSSEFGFANYEVEPATATQ